MNEKIPPWLQKYVRATIVTDGSPIVRAKVFHPDGTVDRVVRFPGIGFGIFVVLPHWRVETTPAGHDGFVEKSG